MLSIGLGSALKADDLLSAFGRRAAADGGWYEFRWPLEAGAVATVGVAWPMIVGSVLWRTPE